MRWKHIVLIVALIAVLTSIGTAQLSRMNKLSLGPTAFSTGRINLAPHTAATGGIYFGDDVTLYRSAANTLKTDDALAVTGAAALASTLAVTGNTTVGGTLGVTGNQTNTADLTVNGNTTLGNAATDTATVTGRLLVRQVTDAGPMTATAGTEGEIAYNLSDNKLYVCTVTSESAGTWVSLSEQGGG